MKLYRAALVGCSRMGAFIDNEFHGTGAPDWRLPYSHASCYEACPRTQLVAGADLRPDVLERFGERYGVAPEHRYTDYREMLARERPEIVSVATQPQHRAAVILDALAHGARALYCEKPLCASMAEADAILAAVERADARLNLGTNWRWHPGIVAERERVAAGELGAPTTILAYGAGTVMNLATHQFDLLRVLSDDRPVAWVQATFADGNACFDGDQVISDPRYEAMVGFEGGLVGHVLAGSSATDHEVVCQQGSVRSVGNTIQFELRRFTRHLGGRWWGEPELLPFEPISSTIKIIEDLVQALDTGGPTRGGVREAHLNTQMLFAAFESQRRGGPRVALPFGGSPLVFAPRNQQPRTPRYGAKEP